MALPDERASAVKPVRLNTYVAAREGPATAKAGATKQASPVSTPKSTKPTVAASPTRSSAPRPAPSATPVEVVTSNPAFPVSGQVAVSAMKAEAADNGTANRSIGAGDDTNGQAYALSMDAMAAPPAPAPSEVNSQAYVLSAALPVNVVPLPPVQDPLPTPEEIDRQEKAKLSKVDADNLSGIQTLLDIQGLASNQFDRALEGLDPYLQADGGLIDTDQILGPLRDAVGVAADNSWQAEKAYLTDRAQVSSEAADQRVQVAGVALEVAEDVQLVQMETGSVVAYSPAEVEAARSAVAARFDALQAEIAERNVLRDLVGLGEAEEAASDAEHDSRVSQASWEDAVQGQVPDLDNIALFAVPGATGTQFWRDSNGKLTAVQPGEAIVEYDDGWFRLERADGTFKDVVAVTTLGSAADVVEDDGRLLLKLPDGKTRELPPEVAAVWNAYFAKNTTQKDKAEAQEALLQSARETFGIEPKQDAVLDAPQTMQELLGVVSAGRIPGSGELDPRQYDVDAIASGLFVAEDNVTDHEAAYRQGLIEGIPEDVLLTDLGEAVQPRDLLAAQAQAAQDQRDLEKARAELAEFERNHPNFIGVSEQEMKVVSLEGRSRRSQAKVQELSANQVGSSADTDRKVEEASAKVDQAEAAKQKALDRYRQSPTEANKEYLADREQELLAANTDLVLAKGEQAEADARYAQIGAGHLADQVMTGSDQVRPPDLSDEELDRVLAAVAGGATEPTDDLTWAQSKDGTKTYYVDDGMDLRAVEVSGEPDAPSEGEIRVGRNYQGATVFAFDDDTGGQYVLYRDGQFFVRHGTVKEGLGEEHPMDPASARLWQAMLDRAEAHGQAQAGAAFAAKNDALIEHEAPEQPSVGVMGVIEVPAEFRDPLLARNRYESMDLASLGGEMPAELGIREQMLLGDQPLWPVFTEGAPSTLGTQITTETLVAPRLNEVTDASADYASLGGQDAQTWNELTLEADALLQVADFQAKRDAHAARRADEVADLPTAEGDPTRDGADITERAGIYASGEESPTTTGMGSQREANEAQSAKLRAQAAIAAYDEGIIKGKVTAAEKDHQAWLDQHPGFGGTPQELASPTWQAMNEAKGLQQRMAASGSQLEAEVLSNEELWPNQRNDPAAQADLFDAHPTVMGQGKVDAFFQSFGNGGEPIELNSRGGADQLVRDTLGADNPDIARKIEEAAGLDGTVTALPVVYSTEQGVSQTVLFRVDGSNGMRYIDARGWVYQDEEDYRANNSLPAVGSTLVMPSDGKYTIGADGRVKLYAGDARTESSWETIQRVGHVDEAVGLGMLAAGGVTMFASGGAAAPVATLFFEGAMYYIAADSTLQLVNMASHQGSVNPLENPEALRLQLDLATSVFGASGIMRARNARGLFEAAGGAVESGNVALAQTLLGDAARAGTQARVLGWASEGADNWSMVLGVGDLHGNWDQMTGDQKLYGFATTFGDVGMATVPLVVESMLGGTDHSTGQPVPSATVWADSPGAEVYRVPGDGPNQTWVIRAPGGGQGAGNPNAVLPYAMPRDTVPPPRNPDEYAYVPADPETGPSAPTETEVSPNDPTPANAVAEPGGDFALVGAVPVRGATRAKTSSPGANAPPVAEGFVAADAASPTTVSALADGMDDPHRSVEVDDGSSPAAEPAAGEPLAGDGRGRTPPPADPPAGPADAGDWFDAVVPEPTDRQKADWVASPKLLDRLRRFLDDESILKALRLEDVMAAYVDISVELADPAGTYRADSKSYELLGLTRPANEVDVEFAVFDAVRRVDLGEPLGGDAVEESSPGADPPATDEPPEDFGPVVGRSTPTDPTTGSGSDALELPVSDTQDVEASNDGRFGLTPERIQADSEQQIDDALALVRLVDANLSANDERQSSDDTQAASRIDRIVAERRRQEDARWDREIITTYFDAARMGLEAREGRRATQDDIPSLVVSTAQSLGMTPEEVDAALPRDRRGDVVWLTVGDDGTRPRHDEWNRLVQQVLDRRAELETTLADTDDPQQAAALQRSWKAVVAQVADEAGVPSPSLAARVRKAPDVAAMDAAVDRVLETAGSILFRLGQATGYRERTSARQDLERVVAQVAEETGVKQSTLQWHIDRIRRSFVINNTPEQGRAETADTASRVQETPGEGGAGFANPVQPQQHRALPRPGEAQAQQAWAAANRPGEARASDAETSQEPADSSQGEVEAEVVDPVVQAASGDDAGGIPPADTTALAEPGEPDDGDGVGDGGRRQEMLDLIGLIQSGSLGAEEGTQSPSEPTEISRAFDTDVSILRRTLESKSRLTGKLRDLATVEDRSAQQAVESAEKALQERPGDPELEAAVRQAIDHLSERDREWVDAATTAEVSKLQLLTRKVTLFEEALERAAQARTEAAERLEALRSAAQERGDGHKPMDRLREKQAELQLAARGRSAEALQFLVDEVRHELDEAQAPYHALSELQASRLEANIQLRSAQYDAWMAHVASSPGPVGPLDLKLMDATDHVLHAFNGRKVLDFAVIGGAREAGSVAQQLIAANDAKGEDTVAVFLTGFNVTRNEQTGRALPETDGPPGTAHAIATLVRMDRARQAANDTLPRIVPVVVVGIDNKAIIEASLRAYGVTPEEVDVLTFDEPYREPDEDASGEYQSGAIPAAHAFLDSEIGARYGKEADLVMAVELPAHTIEGPPKNMRMIAIGAYNPALDSILEAANARGVVTIGVGDGGNEAGVLRKAETAARHRRQQVPNYPDADGQPGNFESNVPSDHPVTAFTSNLGAQGFSSWLANLSGLAEAQPTESELVDAIREAMIAGAVDGVTRQPTGVDGFDAEFHRVLYRLLTDSIAKALSDEVAQRQRAPLVVAVFDSSDGALVAHNVLADVISAATGRVVQMVFVLDHGNAPFGLRTEKEVAEYVRNALGAANTIPGAQIVCVACNTAHIAHYMKHLDLNTMEGISVAQLVKPTMDAIIASGDPFPATISTPLTADRNLYMKELISRTEGKGVVDWFRRKTDRVDWKRLHESGIAIQSLHQQGAPNWANFVNDGWHREDAPIEQRAAVMRDVMDIVDRLPPETTSVWLACTHYPALEPFIRAALDARGMGSVEVINPIRTLGETARDMLGWPPLEGDVAHVRNPRPIIVTSIGSRVEQWANTDSARVAVSAERLTGSAGNKVVPMLGFGETSRPYLQQQLSEALTLREPDSIDLALRLGQHFTDDLVHVGNGATAAADVPEMRKAVILLGEASVTGDVGGAVAAASTGSVLQQGVDGAPVAVSYVTDAASASQLRAIHDALGLPAPEITIVSADHRDALDPAVVFDGEPPDAVFAIQVRGANKTGEFRARDGSLLDGVLPLDSIAAYARDDLSVPVVGLASSESHLGSYDAEPDSLSWHLSHPVAPPDGGSLVQTATTAAVDFPVTGGTVTQAANGWITAMVRKGRIDGRIVSSDRGDQVGLPLSAADIRTMQSAALASLGLDPDSVDARAYETAWAAQDILDALVRVDPEESRAGAPTPWNTSQPASGVTPDRLQAQAQAEIADAQRRADENDATMVIDQPGSSDGVQPTVEQVARIVYDMGWRFGIQVSVQDIIELGATDREALIGLLDEARALPPDAIPESQIQRAREILEAPSASIVDTGYREPPRGFNRADAAVLPFTFDQLTAINSQDGGDNCFACALALALTSTGSPSQALAGRPFLVTDTRIEPVLQDPYTTRTTKKGEYVRLAFPDGVSESQGTLAELQARMVAAGDGAVALVRADGTHGDAPHWVNAFNIRGEIVFVDPQPAGRIRSPETYFSIGGDGTRFPNLTLFVVKEGADGGRYGLTPETLDSIDQRQIDEAGALREQLPVMAADDSDETVPASADGENVSADGEDAPRALEAPSAADQGYAAAIADELGRLGIEVSTDDILALDQWDRWDLRQALDRIRHAGPDAEVSYDMGIVTDLLDPPDLSEADPFDDPTDADIAAAEALMRASADEILDGVTEALAEETGYSTEEVSLAIRNALENRFDEPADSQAQAEPVAWHASEPAGPPSNAWAAAKAAGAVSAAWGAGGAWAAVAHHFAGRVFDGPWSTSTAFVYRDLVLAYQLHLAPRAIGKHTRELRVGDPTHNEPHLDWLQDKLVDHGARRGIHARDRTAFADAIEALRSSDVDPVDGDAAIDVLRIAWRKILSPDTPVGGAQDAMAMLTYSWNIHDFFAWLYNGFSADPSNPLYENLQLNTFAGWVKLGFGLSNTALAARVAGRMTGALRGQGNVSGRPLVNSGLQAGILGYSLSSVPWILRDVSDLSLLGLTRTGLKTIFAGDAARKTASDYRAVRDAWRQRRETSEALLNPVDPTRLNPDQRTDPALAGAAVPTTDDGNTRRSVTAALAARMPPPLAILGYSGATLFALELGILLARYLGEDRDPQAATSVAVAPATTPPEDTEPSSRITTPAIPSAVPSGSDSSTTTTAPPSADTSPSDDSSTVGDAGIPPITLPGPTDEASAEPPVTDTVKVVAGDNLWSLAARNAGSLLSAEERSSLRPGSNAEAWLATYRLIQFNPDKHVDMSLFDGTVGNDVHDPDLIRPGDVWKVAAMSPSTGQLTPVP